MSTPMKLSASQKGLATILIVILIAILVGGYLIYQNQFKPTTSVPTPLPQQTTFPFPAPTNPKSPSVELDSLVSFNLPRDWTKYVGTANIPAVYIITGKSQDYIDNGGGYPKIGVSYVIGRNSFTPLKTLVEDVEKIKTNSPQTTNFQKIKIDGFDSYSYQWLNENRSSFIIRKSNDDWHIDFTIGKNSNAQQQENYQKEINYIINSVKFHY